MYILAVDITGYFREQQYASSTVNWQRRLTEDLFTPERLVQSEHLLFLYS